MTAAYDPFATMAHDPRDPDPWLALYLDQSLPIDPEAKRCLLVGSALAPGRGAGCSRSAGRW